MKSLEQAEQAFEIRTLLTNINGFAELLADPLRALSARTRLEYAEIILASGEQLEALVSKRARSSSRQP